MAPTSAGAALTGVLRALGLARAAELDRERQARHRADSRLASQLVKRDHAVEALRRERQHAADLRVELRARRDKLQSMEARLARVQTSLGRQRTRIHRLEGLYGDAAARLHGQLELVAPDVRERPPSDADQAADARLATLSTDYVTARSRWMQDGPPAGTRHVVAAGLDWFVPPDATDEGSLSHRLLTLRGLPLDDLGLVRQFVVGGVMLDIGANIGTTSIPRVVLGDFSRVYAAEPNLENFTCLVGNTLANGLTGRIIPDRVALSNTTGDARLLRTRKIGSHRLADDTENGTETVPCFTLDDWLVRLAVAPADVRFVKVDTQGWDVQVLMGGSSLLARRHVVWQIEVSPPMMARAGTTLLDLETLIARRFTHVGDMSPHTNRPVLPAPEVGALLADVASNRRFANLLLFNLP
jgi:FkbM family methyltransferase